MRYNWISADHAASDTELRWVMDWLGFVKTTTNYRDYDRDVVVDILALPSLEVQGTFKNLKEWLYSLEGMVKIFDKFCEDGLFHIQQSKDDGVYYVYITEITKHPLGRGNTLPEAYIRATIEYRYRCMEQEEKQREEKERIAARQKRRQTAIDERKARQNRTKQSVRSDATEYLKGADDT